MVRTNGILNDGKFQRSKMELKKMVITKETEEAKKSTGKKYRPLDQSKASATPVNKAL